MRIPLTLPLLLLLAAPAAASELTVSAVAGGDLVAAVGCGTGNWLTGSIWVEGFVPVDDRRLDAFAIEATAPTPDATYRLAVGVLGEQGRWAGDAWSSGTLTAGDGPVSAEIPGGLTLAPGVNYLAYFVPDGPGWTYASTLTNRGPGVVGMSVLFYTESRLVDLDLPHDRDVAMTATFSQVPEPTILALLGVGLVGLMWRRRRP